MPQKLDTISRFSPGNCNPELLESILVGRGALVDQAEKSILDSVKTGAGHHWLLIGPRGAGKTHLLAILYNRIGTNPEIRSRVVIAYMKEEERGVASFLDWLVRILRAFRRWRELPPADEDLDLDTALESLKGLPLDQAQTAAERVLLRFVGNRRLLLITENLGEIFDEVKGMGREGQQRFRDLVQEHPFWTVIASSQALFEDVQVRDAPFYGFFKVRHLAMFELQESIDLLRKLARLEGRTELREFFETDVGRGRVRAVHQLTGGNPRLLVIFYQFIDRESIAELAPPFLEMVDSLTSYYQEQMHPLPALQQKIVEFLCEHRSPATVKEIAQSCFITHQSASQQLKRLADRRFVVATKVGRESFYELREPLFRICFEVKENLGYPIRLFVDYLGKFYSMEELKRKYRTTSLLRSIYLSGGQASRTKTLDVELGYIGEALSTHYAARVEEIEQQNPLFGRPEPETIGKTVEELFSAHDYREAVKLADAAFELKLGDSRLLLKSVAGHRRMGDLQGARERLDQLVRSEPENLEAWIEKAEVEYEVDDLDAAEESYRRVLVLDERTVAALVHLGGFKLGRGEHSEALDCFLRVTELSPDIEGGWVLLAVAQKSTGEAGAARQSYERATELAPESAIAWEYRGRFLWKQNDLHAALDCFLRVTELRPDYGEGWRLLGFAQAYLDDAASARQSYEKATELAPKDAVVWESRGLFLLGQNDDHAALDCFLRVTELRPDYGEGWWRLGVIQAYLDDAASARESYEKATELAPENANTWQSRGRLLWLRGDNQAALACFQRLTELRSDYGKGWWLLGVAQEKAGDLAEAETSFAKSTDLDSDCLLTWTVRALLAVKQEQMDAAQEYLRKAEALDARSINDLYSLGEAYRVLGFYDGAIQRYRKVLEMEPGDCYANFNIAFALFESGDLDAGMKQMEAAAQAGEDQDWSDSLPICVANTNKYLLQNVEIEQLQQLLRQERQIFETTSLEESFFLGLFGTLMGLLKERDETPMDRLLALRDRVIPELSEVEELSVVCRLFSTGVSYLETQDVRELLKLPREERQSLEEVLKPENRGRVPL